MRIEKRNFRLARTMAVVIALVFQLVSAGSARAEQLGTFPIDAQQLATWSDDGYLHIRDLSTDYKWQFWLDGKGAGPDFYSLIQLLTLGPKANFTQMAYAGALHPGYVSHGTWIAPLGANGQTSHIPPIAAPAGTVSFNPSALSIEWSDAKHGYVLKSGAVEVGADEYKQPLQLLQQMINTYGLDAFWTPKCDKYIETPVGYGPTFNVFFHLAAPATGNTGTGSGSSSIGPGTGPGTGIGAGGAILVNPGVLVVPPNKGFVNGPAFGGSRPAPGVTTGSGTGNVTVRGGGTPVCVGAKCTCPFGKYFSNGTCVPCPIGPLGHGIAGEPKECLASLQH